MRTIAFMLAILGIGPAALGAEATAASDPSHYLDQFVDTSARPGDDFNRYAVGRWLKDHPIPADEGYFGVSKVVQEETYERLRKLSEQAAAGGGQPGSNAQKIGDFWFAAMDTATIERQRVSALQPEFNRIRRIRNRQDVLDTAAHLQFIGAEPLFSLFVAQDEKNSDAYAVHAWQGGLGLPDRDYYFDDDERTRMIRAEYVKHVARMLELLGDDRRSAAAGARAIMRMETALAGASRRLADLRDPAANYHKMTLEELDRLTPAMSWRKYLAAGEITNVDGIVVGQPEFFEQLQKSLATESLANWKTYLRWTLVNAYASELSSNFEEESFHFYGTILSGAQVMRPRWKRMLDEEEQFLGDALGQLYVAAYVPPATKARYSKLTDDIFAAFADRIRALDWMSDETKKAALAKLDAVTRKVAYPEKWKDYSTYSVDRTSFAGNCLRGQIWRSRDAIAKLHKPVDRSEWQMTPQTYNAYYNPSNNEIVLPAAVFVLPGIAAEDVDDALLYAYAGGTTIGHEITHGFDDQGRQYDARGNLRDWWTPSDQAAFEKRAAGIVKQFDDYVVIDGLHCNGAATEGENIADLGGILLGWQAFTRTEQYQRGAPIGGYTPAQRYFIGWTLGWMNNVRPERLALQVKTDVHAPEYLRVNGPVSNMPPFFAAFDVKPGDPMYRAPADIVRIW